MLFSELYKIMVKNFSASFTRAVVPPWKIVALSLD